MTAPPRVAFDHGKVSRLADITDLVALLFPNNQNQQHAAARLLLALREQREPLASFQFLESEHGISRRTLERVRAKLSRLGLIQHVTWMNRRYGGQTGWVLSTRFASSLRRWANFVEMWSTYDDPERLAKERQLVELLAASGSRSTP